MKIDMYTKVMLTLIVVGLFANVLKDVDFVSKAQAGASSVPGIESVSSGVVDVNIVRINGSYISTLPVKVENTVEVKGSVTCR